MVVEFVERSGILPHDDVNLIIVIRLSGFLAGVPVFNFNLLKFIDEEAESKNDPDNPGGPDDPGGVPPVILYFAVIAVL